MTYLVDKDIKTVIIAVLYVFKKLEEWLNMLTRDMEYIKTQIEFLEMKITVSEMKNVLDGINGRLDIAEENITEFEYLTIETLQNETQWD